MMVEHSDNHNVDDDGQMNTRDSKSGTENLTNH